MAHGPHQPRRLKTVLVLGCIGLWSERVLGFRSIELALREGRRNCSCCGAGDKKNGVAVKIRRFWAWGQRFSV